LHGSRCWMRLRRTRGETPSWPSGTLVVAVPLLRSQSWPHVFLKNTAVPFGAGVTLPGTTDGARTVTTADVDTDGDMDVIAASSLGTPQVWRGARGPVFFFFFFLSFPPARGTTTCPSMPPVCPPSHCCSEAPVWSCVIPHSLALIPASATPLHSGYFCVRGAGRWGGRMGRVGCGVCGHGPILWCQKEHVWLSRFLFSES
jgi:hypothetical protein